MWLHSIPVILLIPWHSRRFLHKQRMHWPLPFLLFSLVTVIVAHPGSRFEKRERTHDEAATRVPDPAVVEALAKGKHNDLYCDIPQEGVFGRTLKLCYYYSNTWRTKSVYNVSKLVWPRYPHPSSRIFGCRADPYSPTGDLYAFLYPRIIRLPIIFASDLRILRDKKNQLHCEDPENIYCCHDYAEFGVEGFGVECVPASTYKHNRPKENTEQREQEENRDGHSSSHDRETHNSHGKIRVDNMLPRPDQRPVILFYPQFVPERFRELVNHMVR